MASPMYTSRQLIFIGFLTLSVPFPIAVRAAEIHVPGDYPTIQEAIDAAAPGWTILVAAGTYTGPLNTNLDFGGRDIELRSEGGPEVTIIDCAGAPVGLTFHSGETVAAIVDGFTITRGGPHGIRCQGSSPTIRNCIVAWNPLNGMICNNSSPVIENCIFADNCHAAPANGAGIHCTNNSSLRIANCVFVRNDACCGVFGGGIYSHSSSLTITGSVFMENPGEGGGGIACEMSSLVISDSHFQNNSSDNDGGGGIGCYSSSATITGCTFYDNTGRFGTGLVCSGAPATITNCAFVANGVGSQVSTGSGGILENTIIAFGTGIGLACLPDGVPTLLCCDIFGNQGGDWIDCIAGQLDLEGNFAADPQFCNLASRNLTLNESSPCLPGNHPQGEDCGLIGAFGQGCGATPVQTTTWGAIKAAFGR